MRFALFLLAGAICSAALMAAILAGGGPSWVGYILAVVIGVVMGVLS